MPSSYNGWPASRDPQAIGINRTWEPIKGHDFPGGVKSGNVETVMTYLVRQLDKRVEPIHEYPAGDEWGWYYRANVNNPDTLSCHASGTAIDYNATQHPNKVKYTWTPTQVREIHEILDELDGVVRWLEGFDEMHFEIRGNTLDVFAVATKIRKGLIPPATIPPPPTLPPPPPPPLKEHDDMFSYEYEGGGGVVLILVAAGKQVRLTGQSILDRRRSDPSHLGSVGPDEVVRFNAAYGTVIQ